MALKLCNIIYDYYFKSEMYTYEKINMSVLKTNMSVLEIKYFVLVYVCVCVCVLCECESERERER